MKVKNAPCHPNNYELEKRGRTFYLNFFKKCNRHFTNDKKKEKMNDKIKDIIYFVSLKNCILGVLKI